MGASTAADVIEVVLSWGGVMLEVAYVTAGERSPLGEEGDMLLPAELLGAARFEVVRYKGDHATVAAPARAGLRLTPGVLALQHPATGVRVAALGRGDAAEIAFGPFTLRVTRVVAERCRRGGPLVALREGAAGYIAGSAFFHVATVCFVALVAPSLQAAEEDDFEGDRIAYVQRMLNTTAARETNRPLDDPAPARGREAGGGQPARGADGEPGKADRPGEGRWAARGDAHPETATRGREHALSEAAAFGAIGLVAGMATSDPDAPTVPWGKAANGSDDVSTMGRLFGYSIDDVAGSGGIGLQGMGGGGGGTADAIGANGIATLGHGGGGCGGAGPCSGVGHGHGLLSGGRTSHFSVLGGSTTVNGRMPPEVIQRVVRQNNGRFRGCYEAALRANPGLAGRVAVKFVIDRGGAVAIAADGGSDLPDEGVRRCVVSSFLSLSFPAPQGGTVAVVYPIMFSPE